VLSIPNSTGIDRAQAGSKRAKRPYRITVNKTSVDIAEGGFSGAAQDNNLYS
jgi:hypothetical protein